MDKELEVLEKEVAENSDVIASAVTLLAGLAAQIRQMKADPARLVALAAALDAQSKALADAVVANTPAEPEPAPEPEPTPEPEPEPEPEPDPFAPPV